jgi:hypothetical protein
LGGLKAQAEHEVGVVGEGELAVGAVVSEAAGPGQGHVAASAA